MKKLGILALCAALLGGTLAACGKTGGETSSLPSLADVREDAAAQSEDGDNGPADNVADPLEEEPDFVDEGEAAATVSDEEVVSDFDFKMDYPSDWSYLSMEELGLDGYYIFAAGNRATGAGIVVSQPLDAAGESLAGYADQAYAAFDDMIALYEGMGITCQLGAMQDAQLGGRDAKRIDLHGESSEAEFVQTTYVVDTPTGEIITVVVSTYGDTDVAVADTALASIRWS